VRRLNRSYIQLFTALILISVLSIFIVNAGGDTFTVDYRLYVVDESIFYNEVVGEFYITYVNSIADFTHYKINIIVSDLSSWDDDAIGGRLFFDEYRYNISLDIKNLLLDVGLDDVNVLIFNDVIMVFSTTEEAIDILRIYSKNITEVYLINLFRFLFDVGDGSASPNILDRLFNGSINVVFVGMSSAGYIFNNDEAEALMDKFNDMASRGKKPEFIGGLGVEPGFGYISLDIYLRCRSSLFDYSYELVDIIPEIEVFIENLIGSSGLPIKLYVYSECPGSLPMEDPLESGSPFKYRYFEYSPELIYVDTIEVENIVLGYAGESTVDGVEDILGGMGTSFLSMILVVLVILNIYIIYRLDTRRK